MALSLIEIKMHARQIGVPDIGLEGQEQLNNSEVVLLGLTHIGIAVVRTLLGAGVGKIRIIDQTTINETLAGSQTLFGMQDIGKKSCIALKDKELGVIFRDRLQLHCVRLTKENAHFILPENCRWVIDTSCDPDYMDTLFDLADQRGFSLIIGATGGWKGMWGIYNSKKNGVKERLVHFFKEHNLGNKPNYLGHVSLCVGGMITNTILQQLVGLEQATPCVYSYDGRLQSLTHENY